jgi:hypothetical protein
MADLWFRLPASGSAAVSPALQSYTHTLASTRRPLPTSDATALATQAVTPDAADHAAAGDSFHVQFVSDALTTGTVFDVGNVIKCCVQGLEPSAANNQTLQIWVGVYSNDGATLRQTLRAKVIAAEFNTALRSVFLSTTVASAYTTVSGDRLVVEFSCQGTPGGGGGTQGHNASMRWGSDGAGGDLAENDTQTGTTLNPWFEISSTPTDRQGRISAFELEVPNAPRRVRVSAVEIEVPTSPRRVRVSAVEFEVPDAVADKRVRISAFEFEVPNAPRRARVSAVEIEVPNAPRRVRISAVEMEVPGSPRRVRVSAIEIETPDVPEPRRVRISAFELEVPALYVGLGRARRVVYVQRRSW